MITLIIQLLWSPEPWIVESSSGYFSAFLQIRCSPAKRSTCSLCLSWVRVSLTPQSYPACQHLHPHLISLLLENDRFMFQSSLPHSKSIRLISALHLLPTILLFRLCQIWLSLLGCQIGFLLLPCPRRCLLVRFSSVRGPGSDRVWPRKWCSSSRV